MVWKNQMLLANPIIEFSEDWSEINDDVWTSKNEYVWRSPGYPSVGTAGVREEAGENTFYLPGAPETISEDTRAGPLYIHDLGSDIGDFELTASFYLELESGTSIEIAYIGLIDTLEGVTAIRDDTTVFYIGLDDLSENVNIARFVASQHGVDAETASVGSTIGTLYNININAVREDSTITVNVTGDLTGTYVLTGSSIAYRYLMVYAASNDEGTPTSQQIGPISLKY